MPENKFDNAMRQIVREAIMEVREEMSGAEDLNQYVPKKAFKTLEKLNIALKELAKATGEEHPQLLDTSSGVEFFFDILSDVKIENGVLKWVQEDHEWNSKGPHDEEWNVIRHDDDEGYWFDEYDFKDQVSYLNKCIKKAIKYFQEYSPDMDDDENARDKFLGEL